MSTDGTKIEWLIHILLRRVFLCSTVKSLNRVTKPFDRGVDSYTFAPRLPVYMCVCVSITHTDRGVDSYTFAPRLPVYVCVCVTHTQIELLLRRIYLHIFLV